MREKAPLPHSPLRPGYSSPPMGLPAYRFFSILFRGIHALTIRSKILHPERLQTPGPCLYAVTHLGHMEPVLLSLERQQGIIQWVARTEYYSHGCFSWLLQSVMAIPVNRQRISTATFHAARLALQNGHNVGIFPEGGVKKGPESAIYGGELKRGACLMAQQNGLPVIPVVVIGTEKLTKVGPWLPFKRGRIWIAVGMPLPIQKVEGKNGPARRAARRELADRMSASYQSLFEEIKTEFALAPHQIP